MKIKVCSGSSFIIFARCQILILREHLDDLIVPVIKEGPEGIKWELVFVYFFLCENGIWITATGNYKQ